MQEATREEVLIPEIRQNKYYRAIQKDWRGRPKGQRLKYRWKTRPYRHQVEAVKKLISTGFGGALLMEPRTGKTKVAIDYASILHAAGKVGRVLVVCPVSVLGVWQDQIAQHCPWKTRVVVWDKDGRKETRLPSYGNDSLDFVIINYDAFSTPGAVTGKRADGTLIRSNRRGGRYDIKKTFMQDWVPDLIILDESHRIKSPSAAKSRMIHTLASVATYRVIMTGTLVTKKKRIFDIYSQWKFLNPKRFEDFTFSAFKRWIGVWVEKPIRGSERTYPYWVKNREGSINRLKKEIHDDSYAITREECFDLPPRLDPVLIRVPLESSGPHYDEMAEQMVTKIKTGEIVEASIPIVVRLRLQQITSGLGQTTGPTGEKGPLRIIGNEKLRMLEDLIEDQFELDEKVVIGALFRPDIQRIVRMINKKFKEVPAFELHGGVSRTDRDLGIKQFRQQEGAAAFIMQPNAGSLGIDLSTASMMVWYSLTASYVDFTQSEDRIALSGKANRYVYLLGGPVDELMYQTLQEDADVSKMISRRPELLLRD